MGVTRAAIWGLFDLTGGGQCASGKMIVSQFIADIICEWQL